MAIFFNKVERPVPGGSGARKWYGVLKTIRMAGQKEVARQIADETTLNPKEAEMALDQLKKVLIYLLLNGQSVQLGDWGSFRLTCNSTGHETKGGVTANSIRKLNIRFTAGKELRDALSGAQFLPVENLASKGASGNPADGEA